MPYFNDTGTVAVPAVCVRRCSDIRVPANLTADSNAPNPFLCTNASSGELGTSSAGEPIAGWVWIAIGVALAVILLVAVVLAFRSRGGRNKTYDVAVVQSTRGDDTSGGRSRGAVSGTGSDVGRGRERFPVNNMTYQPREDFFDDSAPGGRYDSYEFGGSFSGGSKMGRGGMSSPGADLTTGGGYMTIVPGVAGGDVDSTHV